MIKRIKPISIAAMQVFNNLCMKRFNKREIFEPLDALDLTTCIRERASAITAQMYTYPDAEIAARNMITIFEMFDLDGISFTDTALLLQMRFIHVEDIGYNADEDGCAIAIKAEIKKMIKSLSERRLEFKESLLPSVQLELVHLFNMNYKLHMALAPDISLVDAWYDVLEQKDKEHEELERQINSHSRQT